jgi:hypothetical protein
MCRKGSECTCKRPNASYTKCINKDEEQERAQSLSAYKSLQFTLSSVLVLVPAFSASNLITILNHPTSHFVPSKIGE